MGKKLNPTAIEYGLFSSSYYYRSAHYRDVFNFRLLFEGILVQTLEWSAQHQARP